MIQEPVNRPCQAITQRGKLERGHEPTQLRDRQAFRLRTDILASCRTGSSRSRSRSIHRSPGKVTNREFLARADIDQLIVNGIRQVSSRTDEIVDVHQFPSLLAVAPEHSRRTATARPQDLADQVEDEVHLAAVGMIAGPVERRGNKAQIAQARIAGEAPSSRRRAFAWSWRR